jgi:ribonuclease HII
MKSFSNPRVSNSISFTTVRGNKTFTSVFVYRNAPKRHFSTGDKKAVIGVDEAGLGPMLGPLSVVQVAVSTNNPDGLAAAFLEASTSVNESKKVHISGDMAPVETVALGGITLLNGGKGTPANAAQLFEMMGETAADRQAFPWMAGAEQVKLPLTIPEVPKWNIKGVDPIGFSGVIVHPPTLNSAKRNGINKANLELDYIGKLISTLPKGYKEFQVNIDRLGGRKYYAEHLQQFWPEATVSILEESPKTSSYTCHSNDRQIFVRFMVTGEDTSPLIALASCMAKYTREVHMHLFNQYWCGKFPTLKPTDGYYRDGKRWVYSIRKKDSTVIPTYANDLIRIGSESPFGLY